MVSAVFLLLKLLRDALGERWEGGGGAAYNTKQLGS